MAGMRKEIPKGGTYNCYGDTARKIEIGALEEHGDSIRVLRMDVHKYIVCIDDSVYAIKHRPLKSGHAKNRRIHR